MAEIWLDLKMLHSDHHVPALAACAHRCVGSDVSGAGADMLL